MLTSRIQEEKNTQSGKIEKLTLFAKSRLRWEAVYKNKIPDVDLFFFIWLDL